MAVSGARMTTEAVPLPDTAAAPRPPGMPVLICTVPLLTESVTRSEATSASTSATRSPVTARSTFSLVASAPGTVSTGASLMALTVIGTLSMSLSAPPSPLRPRSLVVTVRVSVPLASALPW